MDGYATDRLLVRDWTPQLTEPRLRADLEDELATILSPAVLRHLPEPLQLSDAPGAVSDWISARADESDVFLVSEANSAEIAGLLILAFDFSNPDRRQCHVGYLLAERAWGRGYATELLTELVEALRETGPMTIIGGVGKTNSGSARVLTKAGFSRHAGSSDSDTDMFFLEVE